VNVARNRRGTRFVHTAATAQHGVAPRLHLARTNCRRCSRRRVVWCTLPSSMDAGTVGELSPLQAAFARSASVRHQRQRFFRGSHSDEPELRTFVVYRFPSYSIPKSKIAAAAHMYGLAGSIQRVKMKVDGGACRLRVQGYSSVIDRFVQHILAKVSRDATRRTGRVRGRGAATARSEARRRWATKGRRRRRTLTRSDSHTHSAVCFCMWDAHAEIVPTARRAHHDHADYQRETGTTRLLHPPHARDGAADSGTKHVGRAGDDSAAL
jgi:hypothetical protein